MMKEGKNERKGGVAAGAGEKLCVKDKECNLERFGMKCEQGSCMLPQLRQPRAGRFQTGLSLSAKQTTCVGVVVEKNNVCWSCVCLHLHQPDCRISHWGATESVIQVLVSATKQN